MKTLVIVLGQLRAHEITFSFFKKNVLETLKADLCICGGDDSDNPYSREAKYKFIQKDPPSDHCYDLLDSIHGPEWRKYIEIMPNVIGGPLGLQGMNGSFSLYYRWLLLKNLRSEGLFEKYDRFILTRSDILHPFEHPDLPDISKVYVPFGEEYGGINDRHLVFNKSNFEYYLSIFDHMIQKPELYTTLDIDTNIEKLVLFHFNQIDIEVEKFLPTMFIVSTDGKTGWMKGEYHDVFKFYIKSRDEYFRACMSCARLHGVPNSDPAIGQQILFKILGA